MRALSESSLRMGLWKRFRNKSRIKLCINLPPLPWLRSILGLDTLVYADTEKLQVFFELLDILKDKPSDA